MNYLKKAIELAQAIDPHSTAPNPRVGCLITLKNKIIATGTHKKYGSVHAERKAIEKLEKQNFKDWINAEIFITLEPCDFFEGKQTPSCTELLIEKKFKKIWIGQIDPHFQGKNIEKIKSQNLKIEVLNDKNCEKLNPFFAHFITKKRPFLTLKIAQSLDGKITNSKKYITNEKSREAVHQMRAKYSAILTTTETILKDNPKLDIRFETAFSDSNPIIIILGKRKIPDSFNLFKIPNRKLLFFKTLDDFLESAEIKFIDSMMTECGAEMNSILLKRDLVDEIRCFLAPQIIGNHEKNSFKKMFNLENFTLSKAKTYKNDLCLFYEKK